MGIRLIILIAALSSNHALGECIGMTSGPIVYDVLTCKSVEPKKDFNPDQDYSFFKNFAPSDRQRFLAGYRGYVVVGKVVKSEAIEEGLSKKKGALEGKDLKMLLPAAKGVSCNGIDKKRIAGDIKEFCCQGSVDAPCLLQTPYKLSAVKVVGAAKSEAGDKTREAAKNSKAYKRGVMLYKKKRLKPAAKLLERARKGSELDVKGHYLLGLIYRKLDDCRKAIPVLQTIFDKAAKKEIWADEEATVRRSNFLLARCYAMTNQPGRATIILNSYLVDPKTYRSEIKESLRNSDFGWINATKEYRDYTEAARKALR